MVRSMGNLSSYYNYCCRRKRIYAAMDLNELLMKEGIDTEELMPSEAGTVKVQLNKDPANPAPFPPFLPLHIFDNEEFDCRNPDEWINLGLDAGVRRPVPGKSLLPTRPLTLESLKRDSECFPAMCVLLWSAVVQW